MPLDGSAVFELFKTDMAPSQASPPCVVMPGGGTAVIFLNMPNVANLTVDFNQFGNHVLAVYPYLGAGLLCDAGKPFGCWQSMGAMAGSATFPKVPAGKYWVVIAADKPGDEGQIGLRFSAKP
jgi:hypothetical protein